jgi:hypothetical protein
MQFRNMILALATLSSSFAWAQAGMPGTTTEAINAQNANNLCRIYFSMPKTGATEQYEAGRKKHMQFHRAQKDTWTWKTFAVETGDNAGMYITSACGHSWKDFDDWEQRMGKADTADGNVNLTPYVQSGRNGFYVYRADMSLAPPNQPEAAMTSATIYVLHPGAAPEFVSAVKKITEALSKQGDWPKTSGWLQLMNGGEGPTFVLLNSRKNWADFSPTSKTPQDVLTESVGKEAADAVFKTVRDSTARLYTEAVTYRPDLSYIPTK